MNICKQCGKEITTDEKAIYLRLVNRGAEEFLCIPCLADYFKCSIQDIEQRIIQYKKMGCPLFDNQ